MTTQLGVNHVTWQPSKRASRRGHATPRILVVEDDDSIAEAMADFLVLEGYEIQVAPNGAEALSRLDSFHPDVILLDYSMPVMDGARFYLELCQRGDHAHTILLSASPTGHAMARKIGLQYLAKPFDLEQ